MWHICDISRVKIQSARRTLDMRKELLEGLTEDQIAKVKEFDDVRDLLQLAKDEGVELNEEQLKAISGGGCSASSDNKKKRRFDQ